MNNISSINSVLVEGSLTHDPILYETPKGTQVCNFSVASYRFYKQNDEQQKEVSFFDVEVLDTLAERCGEYLYKGHYVAVIGRLKQDRWKDNKGKSHSRVKILGEHVEYRPRGVPTKLYRYKHNF